MNGKTADIKAMFEPPMKAPQNGGQRDLVDIPTDKLEELQRSYVRRLSLKQDNETMSKASAVGYELGLRIVMAEIRKDLMKIEN